MPSPAVSSTALQPPDPRIEDLSRDVSVLLERVNAQNRLLDVLLFMAAGVAGLAILFQFLSPVERRAKEAYGLAKEGHALAMGGERAIQKRDESLFQSSQETVQLVNATLALARDASERAGDLLRQELLANLTTLETGAQRIISDASSDDDRQLVTDIALRERLRANAKQVGDLQGSLRLLRIPITPFAQFLLGMSFHLNGDFEEALTRWTGVVLNKESEAELKSRAWYWIGYERNNVRRFEDAGQAFERAQEGASDSRVFELRRILLESRFFAREDTATIEQGLEQLLAELATFKGPGSDKRRRDTLLTLGNVLYERGQEVDSPAEKLSLYQKARGRFEEAIDGQSPTSSKWALFGLAETLVALKDTASAAARFREVLPAVREEYRTRDELRTRLLAKSSEFIASLHIPLAETVVTSLYTRLADTAPDIRDPLTIYSQVQKRNVTKSEFLSDMDSLWAAHEARLNTQSVAPERPSDPG